MARSVQHFLSLLTVQIQYHCGYKVQDAERYHLKAIVAAVMGR